MKTNKNNSNEVKQFAIGTKIEHNGKLYEVLQDKSCNNCSLASVCSGSDKSSNISGDLLREERIKIFGECSSITRDDNISVVFKEISKDNTKDKYHKIIPLFRDDNPSKLKSVEFDLPNGYVIDKDNSDLDKGIIRFKRKWLTIEEMYNLKPIDACEYLSSSIAVSTSTRKKIVAIITLMDIANYFNGDWEYTTNADKCGYMIAYDKTTTEPYGYQIVHINSNTDMYFGNIMFKNEADAQYVIDNPNFRNILDNIFKV
jgi:hypothetical protein